MRQIQFGTEQVSALGLGTWHLGEGNQQQTEQELAALKLGLQGGINVIDTAEMYGEGRAETLVGRALRDVQRDNVFLISKFYPHHATPALMKKSLTASLKRLGTDYLDLYLLHWRGNIPLQETVAGLEQLQQAGYIRHWGVSNFDLVDLQELWTTENGRHCFANEDLYNLGSRGVEFSVLPWQQQRQIAFIGYAPFGSEHGDFFQVKPALKALAAAKGVSVQQIMLAWILQQGYLTIPKAGQPAHMQANLAALQLTLSAAEIHQLEQDYPAPTRKQGLDVI
jgi:diketogulonate reductase-like aldo/keto reductase